MDKCGYLIQYMQSLYFKFQPHLIGPRKCVIIPLEAKRHRLLYDKADGKTNFN